MSRSVGWHWETGKAGPGFAKGLRGDRRRMYKNRRRGKRRVCEQAPKLLGAGFAKWAGWRGAVRRAASGLGREVSRCEVGLRDVVVEGGATLAGLGVDAWLIAGGGGFWYDGRPRDGRIYERGRL
jgi:hypothetical protein